MADARMCADPDCPDWEMPHQPHEDCPECGGWGRVVLAVNERHKPVGWGGPCPRGCESGSLAEREMEAARDLVRRGRWWLDLTPEDVERGARAVLGSPQYRAELEGAAASREATDG